MPYINIEIAKSIEEEAKKNIVTKSGEILREEADKPEEYLMIKINRESEMCFGSEKKECAYIDLRVLGKLSDIQKNNITEKMSRVIAEEAKIDEENIYITFTEISSENWGHNGKTFA